MKYLSEHESLPTSPAVLASKSTIKLDQLNLKST